MLRALLVAVVVTFLAGTAAPSSVQADSVQARAPTKRPKKAVTKPMSKAKAKATVKSKSKSKPKPTAKRTKAKPKKSLERAADEEKTPRAPLP